jgi:hypothetical protein
MVPNNLVLEYWRLITEALVKMNVDLIVTPRLADKMRKAGFINVVEDILLIPIGTWPKDSKLKLVGLFWRTVLVHGIQGIALGPLTRIHGWSRERVEVWLVEVRKAYEDNSVHMFMPIHMIRGQRPSR